MKNWFCISLLFLILLSGCNWKKEINPTLATMKMMIDNYPDSALIQLENLNPDNFDKYNRSYYYLLLTEARNRSEISLLESDSLIDISLQYFNKRRHPELLAEAYLWKGRILNELQEPHQAAQTLLKGINIIENKNNNPEILSKLYDELGSTYLYECMYDEALEAFRKEYKIDLKTKNSRNLTFSLRNLGSTYEFSGKSDSAFYYYEEALKQAVQSSDSIYLSDIIHNDISIWHKRNGEYEKALHQLNKINNPTENVKLNEAALLVYFNQLDSAAILLNSIIESDNIYIRATGNKYFSQIEIEEENYKTAFDYFSQYKLLSDSIYNQRKDKELKIVNHLYKTEKETIKLKNSYKTKTIILIFSVAILLFTVFFISIVQKKKRELKEKEKEKEILKTKQSLLFKEKEVSELSIKIIDLLKEIEQEREKTNDNNLKIKETD